jgi:UDP-N-acetylglucosamine 4,6-dehydratase
MNSNVQKFPVNSEELAGKSVLVTGGTGSFGNAFVRRALETSRPSRLIVFSRDETKQYEMAKMFPEAEHSCMRYFIGDVRDCERLTMAMRGVDIVIHAAALKHVPTAEYNPFECIRTNVHGAENVVSASIRAGVSKVIALSTDKAVNSINLYGASKLASDKIFIAANHLSAGIPLYSVVRYGNVLASRGSVVPFFRELSAKCADHLPITDMRMTRFWITLRQGVDFVLSSLSMMQGGEIFVPHIPSMRVIDLARVIAPQVPLKEVGLRPGEKLHEVLIAEDDARNTLQLSDRFVIAPTIGNWWSPDHYRKYSARPVREGFSYTSNANSDWLDDAGLLQLLQDSDK